ncbi:MAG TPA: hypothetical protein VIV40_25170, partial [Kofleriaceae bacterium]
SLHEEEARRVGFSIAWQQPGTRGCVTLIELTPPVAVTPRNLMKIAPATWHDATAIAVRTERDELVAWALLERNTTSHEPLLIRVLGPGVLRVDYAGIPRGLYARGEILFIGGNHRVKSPAQWLTRAFPSWAANADANGIAKRAAIVTRLAERTLEHGHGAMILIVPAELAQPRGIRVHYSIGAGADVLIERDADDEAIELVARLTGIDNALMIDTDLRVRGFGVQVIEGDAPNMEFEHANPYGDDVHVDDLSTFKGTRHPAGVIFCMRQDTSAAAIIVSQDGQLSLAIKNAGDGVQVLGSYERAFGWR